MGRPVVHFEIIGRDPEALRRYYAGLFGWEAADAPVAAEVSDGDAYGFIDRAVTSDGTGIPGGIGGGAGFESHALFYVGVDDVEAALQEAERLGGRRVLGPAVNEKGGVVVGHFRDPEGNLVGVAGPA
jgi:predicted enzyme related to lactoylglutathione lyase